MIDYPWRPSWAPVLEESGLHPHLPEEMAGGFTAADGGSTEYEVLNWLHATVRALKPGLVLETGGFRGIGTAALAHACKLNGHGRVVCLEHDGNSCARIEETLEDCGLRAWADVHWASSTDFLLEHDMRFDVAFFDSDVSTRAVECGILLKKGLLGKVGVFHDTNEGLAGGEENMRVQAAYRRQILLLSRHPSCTGMMESKLSRGFTALFVG